MNLNDYFDPIDIQLDPVQFTADKEKLYKEISIHSVDHKIENIENTDVAIIGVLSNTMDSSSENGLLKIREYLYSLTTFNKQVRIYDLGNFKKCKTLNDHNVGLRDVIIELITLKIMPVIIGSVDNVLYPNYNAYQKLDKKINLVNIDSRIVISEDRKNEYKSALWKMLIEDHESLFFFTNIGYQTHFVGPKILKFLNDQLHFAYRLGYIRSNLKEVEPIFRDADLIGLNISSVRQSDAFGQNYPSPNGYYGEEICQLARYAGMSPKLTSFNIYDYNFDKDINTQTAHLIAQIIWYFIDGYNYKNEEYPLENEKHYKKIIVNLDNFENELVFYNSKKTDRWWLEVPFVKSGSDKQILISCTEEDYLEAMNGDVPERWLRTFQKIN